jgi:hypothetical protein
MISLLFSLSSLWTASRENASLSANGGASTYLGFRHLQAQGRGGGEPPREWARSADLGRPAQVHFGPVWSPLHTRGSSWHFALYPLQLHHFDDDILASKMEGLLAWSSIFYASVLGGCSL